MTSELQWLNFCIDEARKFGHADKAAALERLRTRLSPDRERVARAIAGAMLRQGHVMHGEAYWDIADAAINAMGEP